LALGPPGGDKESELEAVETVGVGIGVVAIVGVGIGVVALFRLSICVLREDIWDSVETARLVTLKISA
jgi:hypothetical protein